MTRRRPPDENENLGSFYMGRMRPPPKPERVLPKGMLSVISLAAFAIIIWYAYPQAEEKYETTDAPLISADTSAYKFKPDDPGGLEVRHRDSTVVDPLEQKAESVERLMPAPEQPVNREEALQQSIDSKTPALNLERQMKDIGQGTEKIITTKATTEDVKPVKTDTDTAKKAAVEETPKVEAKKETAKKEDVKKDEPKKDTPKKETAKPAAKPADKTVTAAKTDTSSSGVYIRLASYKNADGAQKDWAIMSKKYPQLLGGLNMRVMPVDLGAKGRFHRLEAGKVSPARAKEICDSLSKANSGGCIIVK